MSARRLGIPAVLLLLAGATAAQPPTIEPSARRALAAGESLRSAVEQVRDGWVGWAAPTDRRRDLCCWNGAWRGGRGESRGCSLAARSQGFNVGDPGPGDSIPLGSPSLIVLLQRRDGRPVDLRMVGEACPVRRDGESLSWLSGAAPEESLALLEDLADGDAAERVREAALAAAALHDLPDATTYLEDVARSGADREMRDNAVFWLGEARGESGYRALDRLLAASLDGELEEKVVFALSVSDVPEAHRRLRQLAGGAARTGTRTQALFWLAQSGDPGVESALWEAAEQSADDEVREQAVFAMSQLPGERAVDALLRALRDTRHADVRKQALFWLAESDDPRALDEIEKLLQ
ncbi:MAG: HEAT repeat domain-containing protein [Thermoanaerobaculia bacterium]